MELRETVPTHRVILSWEDVVLSTMDTLTLEFKIADRQFRFRPVYLPPTGDRIVLEAQIPVHEFQDVYENEVPQIRKIVHKFLLEKELVREHS